jgi:hypothetical protein
MTVKLSSASPDPEQDLNGLIAIRNALLAKPRDQHLVIGIVDCAKKSTEYKADGDAEVPTARFIQIEPLEGPTAEVGRQLLDRAHRNRTGRDPLPFDWDAALDGLDGGR